MMPSLTKVLMAVFFAAWARAMVLLFLI